MQFLFVQSRFSEQLLRGQIQISAYPTEKRGTARLALAYTDFPRNREKKSYLNVATGRNY